MLLHIINNMPISKLFWFAAIVTIVFLGLQIIGYPVLEVIISLMIIDMIALKVSHEDVRNKADFNKHMGNKVDRIGEILLDMTNFMREKPASNPGSGNPGTSHEASHITLGGIERGIQQSAEKLRQEFKEEMDKIAKKAIEIENALHHQKKSFSCAVGSLDDRIKSVENEILESVTESGSDFME